MGKHHIKFFIRHYEQPKLMKPVFCKMSEIRAGRHCYNVYVRVVEMNVSEINKFNGETIKICDGVVGDESACANFRLVGDNIDKIKKDMVISLRNGRSEVVDEHIRLEVDKFGKVQEESGVTIDKVKMEENISSYAYVKKE